MSSFVYRTTIAKKIHHIDVQPMNQFIDPVGQVIHRATVINRALRIIKPVTGIEINFEYLRSSLT